MRSAVEDLRHVNVGENGMVAVEDALAQVGTELKLLRTDVSSELQPQVDAVASEVDNVRASAHTAIQNPTQATLQAVRTDLAQLRVQVSNLRSQISQLC